MSSQNRAALSTLSFIASFLLQGMFVFFKNMLNSYLSWIGSSQSSLSDGEVCELCANQNLFSRQDMDRVMERLGILRKEAVESTERRSWKGSCQDCTFLQGVSLLEEKEASMDELKGAFSVFDQNGDGFITEVELQQVMQKLELEEGKELESCRKMIGVFDRNGDGKIDLDEFKLLLENTA